MAFNKGYVKEKMEGFRRFTPLLRELVVRDIKVRYRHSALGLVWTVLNPLLMMVVITIVFSTLFKQNIPNFPIYYLSGSLIFAFNSESTTTALNSIISNASLIKKVYIPKYLFPLSNVLSGLVNLGFSLIAMFIVMLITERRSTRRSCCSRFPFSIRFSSPSGSASCSLRSRCFSAILRISTACSFSRGHTSRPSSTLWRSCRTP